MLSAALLLALSGSPAQRPSWPIAAAVVLPELVGSWQVVMIGGLDRPRPDSARATATIAAVLQACHLRERLVAANGNPPHEALVFWGANGPDSAVQRVFAHSRHGRFGVYQGRRVGSEIALRQQPLTSQPDTIIVENRVVIHDHDHFVIPSRLSNDRGRTWVDLSRWEYVRARSSSEHSG